MTSCSLPRQATLTDTPHTMVGDMQRDKISLDLEGCNVAMVVMALNEYELKQAVGHRFHTWPGAIQVRMEKEIDSWIARNPGTSVKGFTQGVCDGACVMAIHWKPKS